jgi:transposase
MELTTILNLCHHHRGFVYHHARFGSDKKSVEVNVRPRAGSAAVCSGCHKPAPGYDHLPERRFEFIPVWGFLVFFLYSMRRVQCRQCGVVVVEEVPWSDGKHQLTKAYMLFLARWARKLSWQETAEAFHTSWEKVCFAVEYVVGWGRVSRDAYRGGTGKSKSVGCYPDNLRPSRRQAKDANRFQRHHRGDGQPESRRLTALRPDRPLA